MALPPLMITSAWLGLYGPMLTLISLHRAGCVASERRSLTGTGTYCKVIAGKLQGVFKNFYKKIFHEKF